MAVVFLILGGALLTAFLTGQTTWVSSDAFVQVQQEARRGFDSMARELRQAGLAGPAAAPGPQNMNLTALAGGSNQLNFQVALGYDATPSPGCGGICWGADGVNGQWIHYAVVVNAGLPANNNRQLVRCVTGAGTRDTVPLANGTNCLPGGFRVIANNVNTVVFGDTGGGAFVPPRLMDTAPGDGTADVVPIAIQIRYNNPRVPRGFQATTLTSRVKLRNSS